ncbi:MAG TPA: S8 family serine peptidase [Candidatus Thermoplasmatota archaeon]|nr:S8 family serine peptidase [Candidatus Thermoplasmatota archaeon]
MLGRLAFPTLALTLALAVPVLALPGALDGAARQYVVGFHEMPDLQRGDAYLGDPVVDLDAALRFLVVETRDPATFEARARLDGNVRYVEWNDPAFGRALLVPNDPGYANSGHWGTKKIGAQSAWDRTLGSTSVKVAVIDSGLLATHEEFAGQARVLAGYDTIQEDTTPQDTCGHGTHVAGTIGATINNDKGIAGLAQVTLYPIRGLTQALLGIECSGSTADLAQGLRRAGDQGMHFSSNSWGGGTSSAITDAINYAYGKGVTQVAAAGNDGSCTNCVNEPWRSNHQKVIVVSSTASNDGFSGFSSQGPEVDVAAPGSSIYSSYTGSNSAYATLSGTSMATPHVTGTAALVKTLNPTWGYAQIDNQLKTTAVDLGPAGKDDRFGHGRINANAAVVVGTPSSNQPPAACFSTIVSYGSISVNAGCSTDIDGTIASYAWNWGDGTPNGSGATATHNYVAAGTYTVTLTVTDNNGATDSTSTSVTVNADPDPGTTTIPAGPDHHATSGAAGTDQHYKVLIPEGRTIARVLLDGPACSVSLPCTPDLDVSARMGQRPTDAAYDCRGGLVGSDEDCYVADPAEGWLYVRVHVTAGSDVAYFVRVTYT